MEKFQLNRLSDYSKESIIAEIQRVAALIPKDMILQTDFAKYSRVDIGTIRSKFSSWEKALEEAGMSHRFNIDHTNHRNTKRPATNISNEQLLNEMCSIASRLDKNTLTRKEFEEQSEFAADSIRQRFGTWRNVLKKCGLQPVNLGKRYSDEECFENLLQLWIHYGRQPHYSEINKPPSVVGPKAYIRRWGTWIKALQTFVNKMNQEDNTPPELPVTTEIIINNPKIQKSRKLSASDKRDIPLGLRWKVCVRDRFRCVKCGATPANDLNCDIHADHIIPFSKGGKTVIENLQVLCKKCNLGKGNRSEE